MKTDKYRGHQTDFSQVIDYKKIYLQKKNLFLSEKWIIKSYKPTCFFISVGTRDCLSHNSTKMTAVSPYFLPMHADRGGSDFQNSHCSFIFQLNKTSS